MKALINARTYDYRTYKENQYILFDETILETGSMEFFDITKADEVFDVSGQIVLPGFVAGHTHLYSAFARGLSVPYNPKTFQDILEQLWWKLDHFLELDMVEASAFSFALDQLMAGSTTLIDHHASGQIKGSLERIKAAVVDGIGQRAILAFETSDRFQVDETIQENSDFIKKYRGPFVAGLFGLHASFTLSEETLLKVKQQLGQSGIHIHVAESKYDEEWTNNHFNESVIERLNRFELLNEKSLLVHCTNVNELELSIIQKTKSKIVVNTTSNLNNAVGLPPLASIEAKGIPWFIGNDGLLSSMPVEYLNAYYTAHHREENATALGLDAIRKSILTSFEYAGDILHIKLGKLSTGYVSDFITVPYQEFTPIHEGNIFGHVFFGLFPNLKPKNVFINGIAKVKDFTVDHAWLEKQENAKKLAQKCWDKIEKEGMNFEFKDTI